LDLDIATVGGSIKLDLSLLEEASILRKLLARRNAELLCRRTANRETLERELLAHVRTPSVATFRGRR